MTEGIHKVALVASLATVGDEAIRADKIQNMSKPAVQELTREVRCKIATGKISLSDGVNMNLFGNYSGRDSDDGQIDGENCKTTLCSAAPQSIRIEMEGELFFLFLKLKKKYGEKLTNREVLISRLSATIPSLSPYGSFCKQPFSRIAQTGLQNPS